MSNNFDLKKYLVENKLTTNSRMLNENEVTNYVDDLVDIMSSGAGKATGLTMLKSNVKNITRELKAKGLLDAVSKELTDYINTTEGFTFQDIKALEQHGYDMSGVNRSNLYDVDKMMNENENFTVKLLVPKIYFDVKSGELSKSPYDWYTKAELKDADVTSYTDGAELANVVFDGNISRAKTFEKEFPGLFKVVSGMTEKKKHSKMMNENENPVDSGVAQFPQLVKKYGEEAVRTALDAAYENTWYNIHDVSHDTMDDEEVDMQARAEFKDQIKFFKQNPVALEDLITDTIDSMEEGKKAKHSKMMKESKAVKKVTAGGITYKVGDDDPEDEGIIMYIDKHKNGYFITGGTFRDPHDYAEGEEPDEGYGYAIDFEGNRIDEDDLD